MNHQRSQRAATGLTVLFALSACSTNRQSPQYTEGGAIRGLAAPAGASSLAASPAATPSAGVRRFEPQSGQAGLAIDLDFGEFGMLLTFVSDQWNSASWEVVARSPRAKEALRGNSSAIVVVDLIASTYALEPNQNGRIYFSLPLESLDAISRAPRVAGRVSNLNWRWTPQHIADLREFVLQVYEERAIVNAGASAARKG